MPRGGPSTRTRQSEWKGPSPGRVVKLAARIYRHLTRRVALIALLLAATSGLGAAAVDPASTIGQVLLVVVGILVSVMVLPEAPHRLWNVTAADLAETVPSPHLLDASRTIALAIARQVDGPVPQAVIARVWNEALSGLGTIIDDPSRVLIDLSYRIHVTPQPGSLPIVDSALSAVRCVPGAKDGQVWFSFCSNLEALDREFAEQTTGCLQRELVDRREGESLDEWVSRIADYRVQLVVDGMAAGRRPSEVIAGDGWRVVRAPFEAGPLTESFLPTELSVEFHADPDERRFPVKFSSYFVVGATQVTFDVVDSRAKVICDEYLAYASRGVTLLHHTSLRGSGYRVRASADSVLPPGAGVVFTWEYLSPEGEPVARDEGATHAAR